MKPLLASSLLSLALGAASITGFVAAGQAQMPGPSSPGPREGIGVRGSWEIDVVNQDGTIAETRRFKNALTAEGKATLARLLTPRVEVGSETMTGMLVSVLDGAGLGTTVPAQVTANDQGLLITADIAPFTAAFVVRQVETWQVFCQNNSIDGSEPNGCANSPVEYQFTATTLASDLPVAVDQALRVRVSIAFVTAP